MTKIFGSMVVTVFILNSCMSIDVATNYPRQSPVYSPAKGVTDYAVEQEFQQLNKNYKQDTKGLLSIMMNDDVNSGKAAITVENASPCNMVFAISGNGSFIKIPIGVGQTRGVVLQKGQYTLSSKVCSSYYNETKWIQGGVNLKLNE